MALMSPTDSMFLIGESREQPMHVGSLKGFELPDGADTDLLRTALLDMLQQTDVSPLFRRRPYRWLTTLGQWGWTDDVRVELDHHVRHSALPQPGRVRELRPTAPTTARLGGLGRRRSWGGRATRSCFTHGSTASG